MRIERIVPGLTVADLPEAVREHTEILGLKAVMDYGWIVTLADEAGHQVSLMEIVHPLAEEEWGVRRFFYRDAAGRVVNVASHTRRR